MIFRLEVQAEGNCTRIINPEAIDLSENNFIPFKFNHVYIIYITLKFHYVYSICILFKLNRNKKVSGCDNRDPFIFLLYELFDLCSSRTFIRCLSLKRGFFQDFASRDEPATFTTRKSEKRQSAFESRTRSLLSIDYSSAGLRLNRLLSGWLRKVQLDEALHSLGKSNFFFLLNFF